MIDSTAATVTYLFSDIEGSTRLWENEPERAARTLAWHDEITRAAVAHHGGTVVKMTGDGVHAAFDDAADALAATVELQLALAATDPQRARIHVRCGLHTGADQRRDNDFFGQAVNRAARIMSAAHGGQVLVSRAAAERIGDRLPAGAVLRDLGWVRLRDLGSPEYLFQLVHPSLRKEFPPLRSMASTPNNLAQQLNSFVGRDRDMEQVQQLLASSRLLTLLGIGGLGKSRLSVQVAAIVLDNYRDGVWFVELAAVADGAQVPQAVASVLGVKDESGGPVIDALARFVATRELLIVLDNCEHVVQACAQLARRLLEAGPGVRLLVSSRDGLRVVGETIYPVAPLPAPQEHSAPMEALLAVDSVRLFVDRARAVQPALRLDERTVRAVAEICRRLDGIPLAIELAAARVRAMTVEQIAARLDDRFRLLNRGDRTALPRQQTLRALIDWSHDLLDDQERTLLRRLSVFAGGCTLEAAEQVCSGDGIEVADVLDLLASLVEKSLVLLDPVTARYRMLDTVRQYALERLSTSKGEEQAVRTRHLGHYLALAETLALNCKGPQKLAALEAFDEERDNVLAAMRHCALQEDGAERACRLVLAMKQYFFARGLFELGHQVSVEACAIPSIQQVSAVRCEALWAAGQICSYTGRYAEAQRLLLASRDIAVRRDDRRMIVNVENYLALASLGLGDRRAARIHCGEALRLAREIGSPIEIAVAANALAQVNRIDGRLDEAETLYDEVVSLSRDAGATDFVALGVLGLAMVAISRGNGLQARVLLREALTAVEKTGSRPAAQSVLEVAAGLASQEHDAYRCARTCGAADAHMALTGIRRDPADEAFLAPLIDRSRRALGEEKFASAQRQGSALSLTEALGELRVWLDTANR